MVASGIGRQSPLEEADAAIGKCFAPSAAGAMERLLEEYDARSEESKRAFVGALVGRVVVSEAHRRSARRELVP